MIEYNMVITEWHGQMPCDLRPASHHNLLPDMFNMDEITHLFMQKCSQMASSLKFQQSLQGV